MRKTKTKFDYLYLNKTKFIKGIERFSVIRVKVEDDDRWIAELKARRFTKDNQLGKLAGGCFLDNCKPYDFKKNYKVYRCPFNYKPAKETKHDKFIVALIEAESNMEFIIF